MRVFKTVGIIATYCSEDYVTYFYQDFVIQRNFNDALNWLINSGEELI